MTIKIEYEDMTNEQKQIVDASEELPVGRIPQGLSYEELVKWLADTFLGDRT